MNTYKHELIAGGAVVASNHPLASAAGLQVLMEGGNAVDAAVAVGFALGVVEPMMSGLGGVGFAMLRHAETGAVEAIDNFARAPRAARPDMFTPVKGGEYFEAEGEANKYGPLSVGVPGSLKLYEHLVEQYGRLDLSRAVAPALGLAEQGFAASPYMEFWARDDLEYLLKFPETAAVFAPGGRPIAAGTRLKRPDLAETLRRVAAEGSDYLYRGELGRRIVDYVGGLGGILSMEDFESYEIRYREPVRGSYRGHELAVLPPPSSGGAHLIQMLNLLEGFDLAEMGFGTVEYFHLLAEVMKLAFADRSEYMGDPEQVEVPVEGLISKAYAEERRPELDLTRARDFAPGRPPGAPIESPNTTHFTVCDREGNMAALTQTIMSGWGSRMIVPGTGVLLNNTMFLFNPEPGHANSIAPGKMPLSSMCPTLMFRGGEPYLAIGTPGERRIFPSVMQAILNIVDHGMTIQQAVEAPRIWTAGEELWVERDVPEETVRALAARGHEINLEPRVAGGMNGVLYDPRDGMLHGGACAGYSGGDARPYWEEQETA